MEGLRELQEHYNFTGDIRGLGLMIGIEFRTNDHKPAKKIAKAVQQACKENGLLLLTCGPWENTIRLIPPLVVTSEQVQIALRTIQNSLSEINPN